MCERVFKLVNEPTKPSSLLFETILPIKLSLPGHTRSTNFNSISELGFCLT